MNKGEWIIWRNFGAYSLYVACEFNGYELPRLFYLNP
jgi:hypothetical protein